MSQEVPNSAEKVNTAAMGEIFELSRQIKDVIRLESVWGRSFDTA